jgi:hypothetical protein
MIWKFLSSSVAGTSHIARNETGQDYCRADSIEYKSDSFFIGLAADGAGSASEGGRGAAITCDTLHGIIADTIRNRDGNISTISSQDIEGWIDASRGAIEEESGTGSIRDYACTLLGTITGRSHAVFFQIGDGCIVVREGDGYRAVFWPDQGEYLNTTYFVTDDGYKDHLMVAQSDTPPPEIALFTDGLQNLVLSYPTKSVHAGFFRPLFDSIRNTPDNEYPALSAQLALFLNRAEINSKSDDDKTLILAARSVPVL